MPHGTYLDFPRSGQLLRGCSGVVIDFDEQLALICPSYSACVHFRNVGARFFLIIREKIDTQRRRHCIFMYIIT